MLLLGLFGGSFLEPNPVDYLFGAGIATNIGAAFICLLIGIAWSKTSYWPLRKLHVKLDALHDSHEKLHHSHAELHRKLDRLLGEGEDGG